MKLGLVILVSQLPWLLPTGSRADVVHLRSGGEIHGKVLDVQPDDRQYVVQTNAGRVTVDRFAVERIVEHTPALEEYVQRASGVPDTVEAHWKLAQWCRDRELRDEAAAHFERILELEPEHTEARIALGYRGVGGRWLTREELMTERGLVMYRGKYRTRQEIELLERFEKKDATGDEWRGRLRRWYDQLFARNEDRVFEARQNFQQLDDPRAAEPLARIIAEEPDYELKHFLLEALVGLDHAAVTDLLIDQALYDNELETREQCLEYLTRRERSVSVRRFVKALRSRDNVVVNRAARALQVMEDRSAISPLINALVTEHRRVYGANAPAGGQGYAFSPTSGAFSFGSSGPRVETVVLKNPAVLSALVALSGGHSFQYDEDRWRNWLSAQTKVAQIDLRRDE